MKENYLPQALYWLTYSILALFLLSFIPPFTIGNLQYKKIALLADIEPETVVIPTDSTDILIDTVVFVPQVVTHKIDTCKKGVFCIEDYSADGTAMQAFIDGLNESKNRPVRIAFYGDSFVEGDILTSSLRDTLQRVFGGRGVGYVPITSEVAKYRTTVKHSFNNWKTYSIISNYDEEPRFGVGGFSFEPQEGNMVEYSPGYGARMNRLTLFYSASTTRTLNYTVRDTVTVDSLVLSPSPYSKLELGGLQTKSIQLHINEPDSIQLYGVSLEEGNGLYVDNLAMRGNSGIALSRISNGMLREANRVRPYNLIILQFGLNVVGEHDSISYSGYVESMVRVVNKFKESFNNCSILIVSVSDRSSNQNGTFKTIPGILMMRKAQRIIAKKTGVAFWDLLEAMGGENSMPSFVNAKPSMAAKDYTHLNFKGGKVLAIKLANALLYEQERYAKAKPAL
jgi:lysophospholipase L1-like esterase